jgi:hypothetical protein
MNPPKFDEYDYINFLIATPKVFSCTEAERVQPDGENSPSHDAITRFLRRFSRDSSSLWDESAEFVDLKRGILVLDDSTLDKPYAEKMELVSHHWSGKHHRTVKGINLVTLLWTDGDAHIPCDYRIYHKEADYKTKNDHFSDMLRNAEARKFKPECVLFDSWYSGLENLKLIRAFGWKWLTRFKSNRLINPDGKGNIHVSSADISQDGTCVHLKGYGFIKVFRIVVKDDDIEYWATNDLETDELRRIQLADFSWTIEEYHRGLKQYCGAERSCVRIARSQRNHIGLSIRAFLRLEMFSLKTGYSWFEAKMRIIRDAVRSYLKNPLYLLQANA